MLTSTAGKLTHTAVQILPDRKRSISMPLVGAHGIAHVRERDVGNSTALNLTG